MGLIKVIIQFRKLTHVILQEPHVFQVLNGMVFWWCAGPQRPGVKVLISHEPGQVGLREYEKEPRIETKENVAE
jgi:hypothetical protein